MNVVGFLEQAPGIKSMARLGAALWIGAGFLVALAIALALVIAAVRGKIPDGLTELVLAAVAAIGALGASAWAAIRERTEISGDASATASVASS